MIEVIVAAAEAEVLVAAAGVRLRADVTTAGALPHVVNQLIVTTVDLRSGVAMGRQDATHLRAVTTAEIEEAAREAVEQTVEDETVMVVIVEGPKMQAAADLLAEAMRLQPVVDLVIVIVVDLVTEMTAGHPWRGGPALHH